MDAVGAFQSPYALMLTHANTHTHHIHLKKQKRKTKVTFVEFVVILFFPLVC